ncbi:MAG: leucyl aminopeptidase [Sphaerobacter sp.]|nr:leucyl aminopeptidase [Sphaerobacter sp.]
MEIALLAGAGIEQETDALLVSAQPGPRLDAMGAAADARLDGALAAALTDAAFSGEVGTTLVIPTLGRLPARRLVVVGVGAGAPTPDGLRRAWAAGARAARDAGARRVVSVAPPAGDLGEERAYRAAAEGVRLGLYEFLEYRTQDRPTRQIERFDFAGESESARRGLAAAAAVADAVSFARDLVNHPADAIYPERLAEIAQEVAASAGLECVVHDPAALEAMGAGAILAVGKGSAREPRLIHLTYRPSGAARGTIGLVGKAITFDTGGVNLKPTGSGLEHMKSDMAGGGAVLATMRALAALAVPFTVHGVIAAAENMLSGTAFRPGDVLRAMNGKTIEVISTDAEGRLVLADALTYTARQGAELLIDLATLTGAAIVALGPQGTALYGTDQALVDDLVAATAWSGEKLWPMPLWDEYRELIRGDVADLKNSGGRWGGSITAALFLREFTEGRPWAHLDIAGPAWSEKVTAYAGKGGTGHGVSTLLAFLERRAARE